jgi:hypothetical protein
MQLSKLTGMNTTEEVLGAPRLNREAIFSCELNSAYQVEEVQDKTVNQIIMLAGDGLLTART